MTEATEVGTTSSEVGCAMGDAPAAPSAETFAPSGQLDVSNEVGRAEGSSEGTESPTSHLGYQDLSLAEFRAERSGEFLEPMSRSYAIETFSSPDGLVERVNPDFGDKSGAYDANCADCARAFERSWRGHFEEAAGRSVEIEPGTGFVVEGEPSGETEEWAGERFSDVYDTDDLHDRIGVAGHGASAIVHTDFVGPDGTPGGHAYNIVNDHGEVKVCDAQIHSVAPWTSPSIHAELDGLSTRHRVMAWNAEGSRIW